VLQPCRRADLPQEAFAAESLGEGGEEDLECDVAVVPEVAGEVDDCHPPAPELAHDGVAVPQRLAQAVARLGRGHGGWTVGGTGLGMGCKLPPRPSWHDPPGRAQGV
jgi:hypothetical protein